MTRKRYIKLLMSEGYSRNLAREEVGHVVDYHQELAKYNKDYKAQGIFYRAKSLSYNYDYYVNLMPFNDYKQKRRIKWTL